LKDSLDLAFHTQGRMEAVARGRTAHREAECDSCVPGSLK
jgi:hypothetical protein